MTKKLALLVLALSACAHTPSGPAQVFENAFDFELPRGPGTTELRYSLRWEPGTQVRLTAKSSGRITVKCKGCKGSRIVASAIRNETAKLEFVAGTSGDQIVISTEDTADQPSMTMSVFPTATEVLAEPQSAQARKDARDAKNAQTAATTKNAEDERQAKRDESDAIKKSGAARCARKETVSYVGASSGSVIVNFCDESRATRLTSGKWVVSVALTGTGYDDFVSNEKATMEVAEHNCKVLKTASTCQRAGKAREAFEARVQQWTARNRKPSSWYENVAMQTCAKPSDVVPGSAACAAK